MLDDLADVAGRSPSLLRPRELEEVGQDAIESPRLGPERGERRRALVGGEPPVVGQERGSVQDGREGIADLVSHAGGELARGGQALGFSQSRVEPLTLAAGSLEHHDDDREGRQEVEEDEHRVHHEVSGRARHDVHELGRDAVHAPEGQESGQEPLSAKSRHARLRRPEEQAGGHLRDAEGDADGALSLVAAAHVAGEGQADRCRGADHEVACVQSVAPPVRERGREGQADRGDRREIGDEARVIDVEHEHVDEPEPLGQGVGAPGQEQVLEEANPVRLVEVGEDEQLNRERDRRDERQDQRRGHHNLQFSLRCRANRVPRKRRVESRRCVAGAFHFETTFRCGTGRGSEDSRTCGAEIAALVHGEPGVSPWNQRASSPRTGVQ